MKLSELMVMLDLDLARNGDIDLPSGLAASIWEMIEDRRRAVNVAKSDPLKLGGCEPFLEIKEVA